MPSLHEVFQWWTQWWIPQACCWMLSVTTGCEGCKSITTFIDIKLALYISPTVLKENIQMKSSGELGGWTVSTSCLILPSLGLRERLQGKAKYFSEELFLTATRKASVMQILLQTKLKPTVVVQLQSTAWLYLGLILYRSLMACEKNYWTWNFPPLPKNVGWRTGRNILAEDRKKLTVLYLD